jgi:hypothetical protein
MERNEIRQLERSRRGHQTGAGVNVAQALLPNAAYFLQTLA